MVISSTASGYKKIMWGILLSAVHIEIPIGIFMIQILPMFLGFGLVMLVCMELRDKAVLGFFDKALKNALIVSGVALALWVVGMFLSYGLALTKGLMAMVHLFAIATYGEILNKTVRLYKLEGMTKQADKLRKDRMTVIKIYLVGIVICLLGMIPALDFLNQYVTTSVMFMINLWLSMIVQNIVKEDVTFHPPTEPTEFVSTASLFENAQQ